MNRPPPERAATTRMRRFQPFAGPRWNVMHKGGRRDTLAINPQTATRLRAYTADRVYSAHSMLATFITPALENRAKLEDVQMAVEHRDPSTTNLYNRRGYNPERAASLYATY